MVVVVIIGILASLVAPSVMRRIDEANVVKAKQDIRAYETALNLYRMDNFRYRPPIRVSRRWSRSPRIPTCATGRKAAISEHAQGSMGQRIRLPEPRNARRIRHLHTRRRWATRRRGQRIPTSATGTSSRSSMRAARAANSGFTLPRDSSLS
jgi:type II secretory pathway pseudopilin PulG